MMNVSHHVRRTKLDYDSRLSYLRRTKGETSRTPQLRPMSHAPLKKKSQIILGVSGGVWAGACLVLNASVQY